jgi:hypothetical protein
MKSEIGMVMAILIAAVALVGVLCLLDLLLTFGVIRRLREHTELLSVSRDPRSPAIGLAAGELPAVFTAVTIDGDVVGNESMFRLVGFFSTSCAICAKRVASFVDYLTVHRIERDSVLAIVGAGDEAPPYLDTLAAVARVCLEREDGGIASAFKVGGFPAFCLLDPGGAVIGSGSKPAELPEPAAV